jgi:hypothetical protein
MTIVDQRQDLNGQAMHKLASLYNPPDYCKAASLEQRCGSEGLPPTAFARPSRREYPQHTPAAVWWSAAFFFDKQAVDPDHDAVQVEQSLVRAAKHFGILPDLHTLSQTVKRAHTNDLDVLPDSEFALVLVSSEGQRRRLYPLRNPLEVTKAAEYFQKFRHEFEAADRRTIATKILNRAQEVGGRLGASADLLTKSAGLGVAPVEEVTAAIRSRALELAAIGQTTEAAEIEKLAAQFETHPEALYHYATQSSLIDTLDAIDRAYQLKLPLAEDVVCGITEKAASEAYDALVLLLSGTAYRKADLAGVPLEKLADYLGQDFASAVSAANAFLDLEKLACVLPTLPLNDAELFDRLALDSGIQPAARKVAAARPQLLQDATAARKPTGASRGRLFSAIK